MAHSPNRNFLAASLLLVLLDQVTKLATKGFNFWGLKHEGMELGQSITVIESFLWITFVENPGMAFGIKFGEAKVFLSLFSIVASVAMAWYLYKTKIDSFWAKLGLTLILAGATGNLIDRVFYGFFYDYAPLFYGKVVDFVEVEFFDFSLFGKHFTTWPVFNVADSCVTCGMVLLVLNNKHIPLFNKVEDRASTAAKEQAVPEAQELQDKGSPDLSAGERDLTSESDRDTQK